MPQQAPSELAAVWIPMLDAVSRIAGCTFRFATAPSIPEFERRLGQGRYPLAYMNPLHYTVFSREPGYRAFAHERGRRLRGLIVTRADSGLDSVAALDGRKMAFPSPAAFAATVVPMASLAGLGIRVVPAYVASHDSVYLSVARGLYVAGGGIERTLSAVAPEVRDKLRVVWRSAEYAPHAFAALPGIEPEAIRGFVAGMQALAHSAEGRAALQRLRFGGIQVAVDSDWDSIRALDLGGLPQAGGD
ncbi:MAG: phosphate/phosphite/phosphonate ABC transporter substrate-binding protein [Rhodocyclaceae bacterium]|nr:phosphate/phosphite/phosphonate ABC transporter substrate-binding protein [Rhodocyclaceae bacterium]